MSDSSGSPPPARCKNPELSSSAVSSSTPIMEQHSSKIVTTRPFFPSPGAFSSKSKAESGEERGRAVFSPVFSSTPSSSRGKVARFLGGVEADDSSVFSEGDSIQMPDARGLRGEIEKVLAQDSFDREKTQSPPERGRKNEDVDMSRDTVDDSVAEIADSFAQMSTEEPSTPDLPKYDRDKDRSRSLLADRLDEDSPLHMGSLRKRILMKKVAEAPSNTKKNEAKSPESGREEEEEVTAGDEAKKEQKRLPFNKDLSIFSSGGTDSPDASREKPEPEVGQSRPSVSFHTGESLPDLGTDYPIHERNAEEEEPCEVVPPPPRAKPADGYGNVPETEQSYIDISSGSEHSDEEEVVEAIDDEHSDDSEDSDFQPAEPDIDESGGDDAELSDEDYQPSPDKPGPSGKTQFFDTTSARKTESRPGFDVDSERNRLLEKQRNLNVLKARQDLNLADGGFKLDMQLAKVNSELDALRPFQLKNPAEAAREQKKEWAKMYADGPVQNRLFGGMMTMGREAEARNVIHDSVETLHKALNERPPETLETPDPPGLMIPLMQHQRQGLTWLEWRERQTPRGGILADDMGLGKTLSMIALILLKKQQRKEGKIEPDKNLEKILAREELVPSHATLVVCPASLFGQWKSEVEKRVKPGKLRVEVFHGQKNKRESSPSRLARNDIVLTTYTLVAKEVGGEKVIELDGSKENFGSKKGQSVLLQVGWERIILDEAHEIKNHVSQRAKACCRIPAGNRWALSGTPIHNKMLDFFSLLRFLRCAPFDELKVFKVYMDIEKSTQSKEAEDRVNTVVKALLLRRTKEQRSKETGKPLISLTVRNSETHRINLQPAEAVIYWKMHSFAKEKLRAFLKSQKDKDYELVGISTGRYAHQDLGYKNPFIKGFRKSKNEQASGQLELIVLLTRLRQACAHLSLTKNALDIQAFKEDNELEKEIEKELEKEVEGGNLEDSMSEVVSGACQVEHIFQAQYVSSKLKAVLQGVDEVSKTHSDGCKDKCIVVSQWTSLLDIVQLHLKRRLVSMTRIDGNVRPADRQERVDNFNRKNRGPTVLLLSLKAGGVGLNLVGANHLFLLDLHWNPALEQQAMDRIYRMGQEKNVFVHKFICEETIEERVADLQNKKLELAANVLEGGGKKLNTLSLQDFKFLFSLDKKKDQDQPRRVIPPPLQPRKVNPPGSMAPIFNPV